MGKSANRMPRKEKDKLLSKVIYINQAWQPVSIGFVPSEKAYKAEKRRLKSPGPWHYPTLGICGGHCELLENDVTRECVILVSVGKASERDALEVILTIVHEAVHVWQYICQVIGEKNPGLEMEAYAIENISRDLIEAYTSTQGKNKVWPVE